MNINLLKQKKAKAVAEASTLFALAQGSESGNFTAEQETQWNALMAEAKNLEKQIGQAEELAALERSVAPAAANAPSMIGTSVIVGEDKSMEFQSLGDMLASVADASKHMGNPSAIDKRLFYQHEKQAAASGLNMSTPSEGGFLLQTQFSTALLEKAVGQSMLLPRCRNIPIGQGQDGLEAPYIDETSRATGSRLGGVQVYRNHEASEVTAKKPKFGKLDLRLEQMTGLCYISNRLLQNVPSLGSIISDGFASEFSFKIDNEIVRGTGAGECLGFLAHTAGLASVTKETGQAADTVVTENILKMFSRMSGLNRRNGIWLINSETLPQLQKLSIDVGTGGQAIYMPANGLADDPFDRLLGRPVIDIEQASAIGDAGDISFVDLNEYLVITQGALETATSLHVKFLTNEQAFRFSYLINGQPVPASAKTPFKGTATISPFVTLGAR